MRIGVSAMVLAVAVIGIAGAAVFKYGLSPSGGSSTAVKSFKDCETCPDMVTIPAGEFTMGSPSGELYRGAELQHRVIIAAPFALGKYESPSRSGMPVSPMAAAAATGRTTMAGDAATAPWSM